MVATARRRREIGSTVEDVLEAVERLHDCVHSVGERVDGVVSDVKEIRDNLGRTREDVAHLKGLQVGVSQRLGVLQPVVDGEAEPKKPGVIVITKPWKMIAGGLGCASGVVIVYQIFSPMVIAAAQTFHATIMAMH
jgi:hypothetical protein